MEAYPSVIHKALTLMNEYKPLKLDVTPVPAQRKFPAKPSTLATPTKRQLAQKFRLRSSMLTRKQQRMMAMINLLPVQSQLKC